MEKKKCIIKQRLEFKEQKGIYKVMKLYYNLKKGLKVKWIIYLLKKLAGLKQVLILIKKMPFDEVK